LEGQPAPYPRPREVQISFPAEISLLSQTLAQISPPPQSSSVQIQSPLTLHPSTTSQGHGQRVGGPPRLPLPPEDPPSRGSPLTVTLPSRVSRGRPRCPCGSHRRRPHPPLRRVQRLISRSRSISVRQHVNAHVQRWRRLSLPLPPASLLPDPAVDAVRHGLP
jgi:hypothetical protein